MPCSTFLVATTVKRTLALKVTAFRYSVTIAKQRVFNGGPPRLELLRHQRRLSVQAIYSLSAAQNLKRGETFFGTD